MDVGAAYGNYASDMTRTVPVSGKFTPRQRTVYEAVLRVEKAAMQLLVPEYSDQRIPSRDWSDHD